ncbi:MAG: hypothetical protein AB7K41_13170 [Bdellovibrionales bacterium]
MQFGIILQVVSLVLTSCGATLAFSWLFFYRNRLALIIQAEGGNENWYLYVVTGATLIVIGIISIFVTLLITHRIVGPMVAIHRQLDSLIDGDFSNEVRLRKHDEFADVAEKVNLLTRKLRGQGKTD